VFGFELRLPCNVYLISLLGIVASMSTAVIMDTAVPKGMTKIETTTLTNL